jgi:hypothetical protein
VVEKKAFVEETHLAKCLDPEHHAGAGYPVYVRGLTGLDHNRRDSKKTIQGGGPGTPGKLSAEARKREGAVREPAISLDQLAADCAGTRMTI